MDDGKPIVPISVNVSRVDAYNPNLVQMLEKLLQKYRISAEYLHLEITETAYTENPVQLIEAVQQLKKLGFIIEMDDFGTGYSSLNMLSELPIDMLKLDMRFLQGQDKATNSENIISFIISLAKWLGFSVVAEGVETLAQVDVLSSMECNYAQGYYFARPMPLQQFELYLDNAEIAAISKEYKLASMMSSSSVALPSAKGENKRKTLLIADDMAVTRQVLREFFCDEYDIVEAENGMAVMQYLTHSQRKVDLVLLDLLMPAMDGFQVLEQMRKNPALRDIPVVASHTANDCASKAYALGASEFIVKPYQREITRHRIETVLLCAKIQAQEKQLSMSV